MNKSFVSEIGAIPPASLRGNSRSHWAIKGRHAREWRESGWAHGLADSPVDWNPGRISIQIAFFHWRPVDLDNLAIGMKPWIDGLVDAYVIEDDSPEHLAIEAPTFSKCRKGHSRTVVTVTERPYS